MKLNYEFNTAWILPIISALLIIYVFLVSGDGHFRYPCQDPNNWKLGECCPPYCEATATCPRYLLDMDTLSIDDIRGIYNEPKK